MARKSFRNRKLRRSRKLSRRMRWGGARDILQQVRDILTSNGISENQANEEANNMIDVNSFINDSKYMPVETLFAKYNIVR